MVCLPSPCLLFPFLRYSSRGDWEADFLSLASFSLVCVATPIPAGLLYYSQSNSIIQVPAAKHELRSLLNARNVLASFLFRKRPPSFESESAPPLPSRSLPPSAPLPRPPPISASLLGEEQQSRRVEMEGVKGTAEQEAEAYEDKEKEREEQLEREMWGEMDREADLMAGDVKMSQTGQESFGGVESRVAEFLPATIDVERECKKCYQVDACMLYRKVGPSNAPPPPSRYLPSEALLTLVSSLIPVLFRT
jgi:hypothetical protein